MPSLDKAFVVDSAETTSCFVVCCHEPCSTPSTRGPRGQVGLKCFQNCIGASRGFVRDFGGGPQFSVIQKGGVKLRPTIKSGILAGTMVPTLKSLDRPFFQVRDDIRGLKSTLTRVCQREGQWCATDRGNGRRKQKRPKICSD